MRIQEVKIYTFDELSEEAQRKAIERAQESAGEVYEPDYVYEDFDMIASILGVELETKAVKLYGGGTRQEPVIYYSGFWSQGDGASFEGSYAYAKGSKKAIRDHAPQDTELHRIADELAEIQRRHFYGVTANVTVSGHYVHSGCMRIGVEFARDEYSQETDDAVTQLLRDLADWLYIRLRDEYEYQTSEESARENILANEYEFTEDGEIA